jgi:hypothetical protein
MIARPLVLDIETIGLPNAADYLEPVEAAKNLKDPEKIAANITERIEERQSKLGLDWNVGRIVAIGWWTPEPGAFGSGVTLCASESQEAETLRTLWSLAKSRTIITFNGRGFDLPFCIQRSRFLGVPAPEVDLKPYGGGSGNVDLWLELTFGKKDTPCMRTSLGAFCRRVGIPFDDSVGGKDIGRLVAEGNWPAVKAHCLNDVTATAALARWMGMMA